MENSIVNFIDNDNEMLYHFINSNGWVMMMSAASSVSTLLKHFDVPMPVTP